MFHTIQKEHCLYTISDAQLHEFVHLTNKYDFHYNYSGKSIVNEYDAHCTFLQIWSAINEHNLKITLDPNKSMLYSSNFYILNLIRMNRDIKLFLQNANNIPDIHFMLAYYLTNALIDWSTLVIVENNVQEQHNFEYIQSTYFGLHEDQTILLNALHPIYTFQKRAITALASDFKTHDRFHDYVTQAIGMTTAYLKLKKLQPIQ